MACTPDHRVKDHDGCSSMWVVITHVCVWTKHIHLQSIMFSEQYELEEEDSPPHTHTPPHTYSPSLWVWSWIFLQAQHVNETYLHYGTLTHWSVKTYCGDCKHTRVPGRILAWVHRTEILAQSHSYEVKHKATQTVEKHCVCDISRGSLKRLFEA